MGFEDLNWMTNLESFKTVENFYLEEMKKRENEEPKFKVIKDPLNKEIQDIFKKKGVVNIFGNGPSLRKIKKNSKHINYCINRSIEVQKNCDILFLGDLQILFDLYNVERNVMKNVKIIMIQSTLHDMITGKNDIKYGLDFIIKFLKCTAFEGIILPFDKLPLKKYNKALGIKIGYPQSGLCSVFALKMLKLTDRKLNYYGISIPSMSKDKIEGYHKDIKKQYHKDYLDKTNSKFSTKQRLIKNTYLIKILDHLKIKYKFH